jgi:hypothetical protein
MDCPEPQPIQPPESGKVIAVPEVGGLHHHYERQAACMMALYRVITRRSLLRKTQGDVCDAILC